jgi:hypothetical protein
LGPTTRTYFYLSSSFQWLADQKSCLPD